MTEQDCARLAYGRDGAERTEKALDQGALEAMLTTLNDTPTTRPGVRLHGSAVLAAMLGAASGPGAIARAALDADCWPVRAVLFDKTGDVNWSLGWHQDRTIVVRERRETAGFGPWTVKQGLQHVAPPFEILKAMATLRIHLDPVPPTMRHC
jgi:hypothetical protein